MSANLKPCPFCGCADVHNSGLYFECMNDACMTLGPTGKTPELAAEAWNRRAPLAASEASAEPDAYARAMSDAIITGTGMVKVDYVAPADYAALHMTPEQAASAKEAV